jgi:hypothetical protein
MRTVGALIVMAISASGLSQERVRLVLRLRPPAGHPEAIVRYMLCDMSGAARNYVSTEEEMLEVLDALYIDGYDLTQLFISRYDDEGSKLGASIAHNWLPWRHLQDQRRLAAQARDERRRRRLG